MTSASVLTNCDSAILARLLETQIARLTPAVAEYFVSFRFDEADIARMNKLAELNREGRLAPGEEAELDGYVRVGDLIAVMQAHGRRLLKTPPR